MANPSNTGRTGTGPSSSTSYTPSPTSDLDEGRVSMGRDIPSSATTTSSVTTSAPGAAAHGGAQIVGGEEDRGFHDGPGPQIMAAETLTGNDVVNSKGEDLGDIEAIMIDVQRGRIAYAVLSMGGFLGMGDKLFAIPWSALKLDADNKCFVLDVDKERLENAPGFDKDNWPAMADMQWASDVHTYYGTRPYWQ